MIELPKACIVDKFVPKKTFYEKVNISNSIREEFTDKLSKIYWRYKISEDTINVSRTEEIEEIEVFELELKEKYNCKNIIRVITKNIPYPILFYIKYKNDYQYAIKYNEEIYFREWNNEATFNFNGLNIKIVYDNIVKIITNIDKSSNDLEKEINRQNKIINLEKEISKLEGKIRSEKQFNIKVQYNEQIAELKKKIEELK